MENSTTEKETAAQTLQEKNLDFLLNQIKHLGFGEGHGEALKQALSGGGNDIDFPLKQAYYAPAAPDTKKEVLFDLHFHKGKERDMYFLNSFSITDPAQDNLKQKFYLKDGRGMTGKEAFNLIEGRSVHKTLENRDGKSYDAWVRMDKESMDKNSNHHLLKNYDYDIATVLKALPVKTDYFDKTVESLKKGNLQKVDWQEADKEPETRYIAAEPQYKNINVYDGDMKKQFIDWKNIQGKEAASNTGFSEASESHTEETSVTGDLAEAVAAGQGENWDEDLNEDREEDFDEEWDNDYEQKGGFRR